MDTNENSQVEVQIGNKALYALISSICGICISPCCCLGIVGSILGVIFASQASSSIALFNVGHQHQGLITTARVLGYIGVVVAIVGMAVTLLIKINTR